MFSTDWEAEREEREVLRIESMILQCCNMPQVTAAESGVEGREGVVVYIEAAELIIGGMEECSRKGEREGVGHLALHLLEKNLWGQPIRGWVTPLSSQLQ